MTRIFFILTTLILAHCSISKKTVDKDYNDEVIYSIDKVGVFIYNCGSKTSTKIYSTDKVFLPSSLEFLNDSFIIVGFQGKSTEGEKQRIVNSKYFYRADGDSTFITDNPTYTIIDKYTYLTETYFKVNIDNSQSYKYKTVNYEKNEDGHLKINTVFYSKNDSIINQQDTTYICNSTLYNSKGITFGDFKSYFSISEIANNRQVFSKRGDLILKENGKETILLKFDGNFDPKFGSGYFNPTISADGKKVAYQYLAGFLNSGSAIFEMNIESKEKNKVIGEGYFKPKYSPDGNHLLIAKDKRECKDKTWISDIYILNIKTGKKSKIAEGDNFIWR